MSMNFDVARTQMLGQQLRAWSVLNDRVLNAFRDMPRESFVPPELRDLAFADAEIPLGHGQLMLPPKVEGRILQSLAIEPIDDVLVIGTGSGYLTACVATLAKRVVSVDIFPDFVAAAQVKLAEHGISNVELGVADAMTLSYPARFDAIAVTGSVPTQSEHFLSMLRPQGRLFVVVGRAPAMEARLITLQSSGAVTTEVLFETVLAPLINATRPEPFVL
jgi:protein-L-isoaspartate(D-aspartate) O-methyltransferase